MRELFGTDGIRGEAGSFPLDEKTDFEIGRDTRESGPWIERSFAGGVNAAGAEISSAGVITTPGVAFLTSEFQFDLGIVISASHNPYQDNGIKAFLPNGRKIDNELESAVEADIAN